MKIRENQYSGYYEKSAYTSVCPRNLPSADYSKFNFMIRKLRQNKLPNFGSAQCLEFFSDYDQVGAIEDIKSNDENLVDALGGPAHEKIIWQSLRNPSVVIEVFTKLLLIFTITSLITVIIISSIFVFSDPIFFLTSDFLFLVLIPIIALFFYFIGKWILKNRIVEDKNNIVFCRRKGLVSIPRKNDNTLMVPFDEFDGYVGSTVNPSGSVDYHLILSHRYSTSCVQNPGGGTHPWKIAIQWECIQQYMDTSRPLPDIPVFEPFRHKDPVTAEYDQYHDRPPRYWRDMSKETAEQMWKASSEAAKQYPWGLNRKDALASGWHPSGCGEGDWPRKISSEEKNDIANLARIS